MRSKVDNYGEIIIHLIRYEFLENIGECMLSVIIPSYNEEKNIPLTAAKLSTILQEAQIEHELIFVDDGSRAGTFAAIKDAQERWPLVRGVKFSRNFGKEPAIMAGLAAAKGDCCAVIDCDLQHPPECLPQMYAAWQQGFMIVEGVKASRGKEGWLYKHSAK